MYADIEALILSEGIHERSNSPVRAPEPDEDPGWHDDEFLAAEKQRYEDQGLDYDSDTVRRDAIKAQFNAESQAKESIGMGPGRTGVKGVIRDRNEHAEKQRDKKAKEVEELRKTMEAVSMGGKTYLEEEREKAWRGEKADELVLKEHQKGGERRNVFGMRRDGRFGHLREVDRQRFVDAIEKEDKDVWVVLHIYDPSLDRCYLIDETLTRLARLNPDTKFLRARAAALGFASTTAHTKSHSTKPTTKEEDEDDPYYDIDEDEDEEEEEEDVDLDMLPTLLVYRGGQLVHNWVRVDWEAGEAGLEELLNKHRILSNHGGRSDNLGFPSDDDDDDDLEFLWNDSDGEELVKKF